MIENLTRVLKWIGIESETLNTIAVVFILLSSLLTVLKVLYKAISFLLITKSRRMLNNDLKEHFSKEGITKHTKYYIPTKYQNISPSEDDEPSSQYIASPQEKLIPFFIKKVFIPQALDNKYFIVLAGAGMGKTTFMINLYLRYKNKLNIFNKERLGIKLIPLGYENAVDKIKEIEKPNNTILLLDALDEDINALDRHNERVKELIKVTKEFHCIIITCRTQFFPSAEEEPHIAGYKTFDDGKKKHKFQKLYLSVFSTKDIDKYLRKNFGLWFKSKYKKAKKIILDCPNLSVRPLLLSYIKDIVNSKSQQEFTYSVEIYETLIEQWLTRESEKNGIAKKYGSAEYYQKLLHQFSEEMAIDLYTNRKKRKGYAVSVNDPLIRKANDHNVNIEDDYDMSDADKRNKSLLNRTSTGYYKFSHKSILEYFLATHLVNNLEFYSIFDFDGMDVAKKFYHEISMCNLNNLKGQYVLAANLASANSLFFNNSEIRDLSLLSNEEKDEVEIIISNDTNLKFSYIQGLKNLNLILFSPPDFVNNYYLLFCRITAIYYSYQLLYSHSTTRFLTVLNQKDSEQITTGDILLISILEQNLIVFKRILEHSRADNSKVIRIDNYEHIHSHLKQNIESTINDNFLNNSVPYPYFKYDINRILATFIEKDCKAVDSAFTSIIDLRISKGKRAKIWEHFSSQPDDEYNKLITINKLLKHSNFSHAAETYSYDDMPHLKFKENHSLTEMHTRRTNLKAKKIGFNDFLRSYFDIMNYKNPFQNIRGMIECDKIARDILLAEKMNKKLSIYFYQNTSPPNPQSTPYK